jgi:cardiolipin synthase
MLAAIDAARASVRLETYIYRDSAIGLRLRDALVAAARRGVAVRVLVDALGSFSLPAGWWAELEQAGGKTRIFNPLHPGRFLHRNHRKSLACDGRRAIIGGFNIADEYDGDGVERGWRDLGMEFDGRLAAALEQSFDRLWSLADFHPVRFARLRRSPARNAYGAPPAELLTSGPGIGANPLKRALLRDLGRATEIRIASAYFLPTWRLRRRLMKAARRGARVQLLLGAKSDVPLAQRAARSLYGRLLRAGVEIWEYQPQVLHTKLVLADRVAYAGSANFNTRSLHIDYELMVRVDDPVLAAAGRALFERDLALSHRVTLAECRRRRGLLERLRERVAYWMMARLDPWVAGWLWRGRS